MKSREILVGLGILAAIGAGVVLVSNEGAEAAMRPEVPLIEVEEPPAEPVEAERGDVIIKAAQANLDASDAEARDAVAAADATSGVIEGRVSVTTDLIGKVDFFHIRVSELVNTTARGSTRSPFDRVWPEAFKVPTTHTPRFRLEDVPFSDYGYRVELIAPECNGSSQIVRVDQQHPFANATLAMTKPTVFTVRLRDQHMNPHANWHLELRPTGDPPNRQLRVGDTDHFGVALFEQLVRGEYVVVYDGYEIGEIMVQPVAQPRNGRAIAVQSKQIVVPVGRDLRVEIFGPAGIGLADVELQLYKTDTTQNRRFEAATDFGGIHTFEFLEAGRYQLDVVANGYQRTSRSVRIPDDGEIEPLKLKLVATR